MDNEGRLLFLFLSGVSHFRGRYLVAGQHVVARVDQDIVAELNAFAPLAHPGVAKLLAFTPNTLVPGVSPSPCAHVNALELLCKRFLTVSRVCCANATSRRRCLLSNAPCI